MFVLCLPGSPIILVFWSPATCQSKHVQRARARRMGVADLYKACSDWSTVFYTCWWTSKQPSEPTPPPRLPCSHLPTGVADSIKVSAIVVAHTGNVDDNCRQVWVRCSHLRCWHYLSATATCQSKHVQRACARRMGVADLYKACSDWSTVRSVGLQSARCRRHMWETFVGACEEAVNLPVRVVATSSE